MEAKKSYNMPSACWRIRKGHTLGMEVGWPPGAQLWYPKAGGECPSSRRKSGSSNNHCVCRLSLMLSRDSSPSELNPKGELCTQADLFTLVPELCSCSSGDRLLFTPCTRGMRAFRNPCTFMLSSLLSIVSAAMPEQNIASIYCLLFIIVDSWEIETLWDYHEFFFLGEADEMTRLLPGSMVLSKLCKDLWFWQKTENIEIM